MKIIERQDFVLSENQIYPEIYPGKQIIHLLPGCFYVTDYSSSVGLCDELGIFTSPINTPGNLLLVSFINNPAFSISPDVGAVHLGINHFSSLIDI